MNPETGGPMPEAEKRSGLKAKLTMALLALSATAVLMAGGTKEAVAHGGHAGPEKSKPPERTENKEQAVLKITPEAAQFARDHGLTIAEYIKNDKTGKMEEVKDPETGEDAVLIWGFFAENPQTKQLEPNGYHATGITKISVDQATGELVLVNTKVYVQKKLVRKTTARFASINPMDPKAAVQLMSSDTKDINTRGTGVER